MTEKREAGEESDSLTDRILHRLISVIPFLLLSSVIAFLLFKYLYEKFGSNFFIAFILGLIIMCGIAFLISTTVGRICKDRLFGNSLAYLIPVTVSTEAMILFGQPIADVILSTFFFGMLFGGGYTFVAVNYMLSPRVNVEVEEIKEDKVVCIRVFSPIVDVERLIEDVLSYLKFSHHSKTPTSDNEEKQWEFGIIPYHYYLSARANDDNSVDLAFLFFTVGSNKLFQSKQNENDLEFVKKTIVGHLRLDDIEYQSIPNSSNILERAFEKYKKAPTGEKLKDIGEIVKTNFKMIISFLIIIIAFMIYIGKDIITLVYEEYQGLFILIAALLSSPLIIPILKILRESDKK